MSRIDIAAVESARSTAAVIHARDEDGITTNNAVVECILGRSAAKYYDPSATLSDDRM